MKNMRMLGAVVFCLLCFFSLISSVAWGEEQDQVTLFLPESVNVVGRDLLLGAIAEIIGPPELVDQVAKINAGTAPLPGSSRRLTKPQIEIRLRQGGLDLSKINFTGAQTIQIFGIAEASTASSAQQINNQPGFPVYEVVVAARELPRGEILVATDLRVKSKEFRSGQPDPRTIEDFVGMRTTRHILADAPLTDLNVEVVPVIERGASVTIVVQNGALVVTAPGITRGSGGIGETIQVENTLSRQRLSAVIIDAHTVEVNMRGAGTP